MRFYKLIVSLSLLSYMLFSCDLNDKFIVYSIDGERVNLYEKGNKITILLINNGLCCHDCLLNLNKYLVTKNKLKKINYYLVYEDPNSALGRRMASLNAFNEYNLGIPDIFFSNTLNKKWLRKIGMQMNLYEQPTPYLIIINKDKKTTYIPNSDIFNMNGKVKNNFNIKL